MGGPVGTLISSAGEGTGRHRFSMSNPLPNSPVVIDDPEGESKGLVG